MTTLSSSSVGRAWAAVSGDRSRQAFTCVAAAAQVLLPTFYGPRFRGADAPPNVIQPAPYAFAVWFPIFAASINYAVHQAREPARTRDVWRAAGWPLAGAFAAAGVWAPLARSGKVWGAQAALAALAVLADTGRRRIARAEMEDGLSPSELAAAAPTGGMLAAWGQAACGVNLAAVLVAKGIVPAGPRAATVGVALLAALGALGVGAVTGPLRPAVSSRSYAATLLWAFAGVMIGQRRRSTSAVVAAAGAAVVLAAAWSRER